MKSPTKTWPVFLLFIAVALMLAACSGNEGEAKSESNAPCTDLANVEAVTVEERSDGTYALVGGYYPDSCTRVSNVNQEVQGDTIDITICTASPPGVMCATVITPFELEILLETGGLESGEYTVVVNDTASTTFTIA